MGQVLLGTSGYKYSDWEGKYYPSGLDQSKILDYYSKDFNTVELNFSYYSIPNPYIFYNIMKKVRKGFIFSVKAHRSVTHNRDYSQRDINKYTDSLSLLAENGCMGCVLLQFPWSFKFQKENLEYIKRAGELFKDHNPVVEFRNWSWLNDKVINVLERNHISFCNVDEPKIRGLLPPTDIRTTETSYIRFHGRNASSWWNHEHAYQRYDYSYSLDELKEWAPRIKKISSSSLNTYIYFNNHYKAKAVNSAKMLAKILEDNHITASQN